MKIGVVGTFIRDKIYPWQDEPVQSIGGLYFTVSYLANLADPDAEIYPVAYVGEDFYDHLVGKLSGYPNIRLDGLRKVGRKNTQVTLTYTGPQQRDEVTTAPMASLDLEALSLLFNVDAVAVNLISGCDVELPALQEFRNRSDALIYLDFHSHALGISEQGKRYYHKPDDWQKWIQVADVLQLNEMEARTLAGIPDTLPVESLIEFGKEVVRVGPQVCHVTLADKGLFVIFTEDGETRIRRIHALAIPRVVDIIGCGDAYAAGFLVKYLKSKDVLEATKFANQVAGLNCTFMGSSGVNQIREMLHGQFENTKR